MAIDWNNCCISVKTEGWPHDLRNHGGEKQGEEKQEWRVWDAITRLRQGGKSLSLDNIVETCDKRGYHAAAGTIASVKFHLRAFRKREHITIE